MKFTQYEPQIVSEAFEELAMEGWGTAMCKIATLYHSQKNVVKMMKEDKIRKYLKQQATEIFRKAKKDPEYVNCTLEEDDGGIHLFVSKNKKGFFTEWLNTEKNHLLWFTIDDKHFLVYGDTDHIEKVEYTFLSTNKETGKVRRVFNRLPAPTSSELIELGYKEED